MPVYTYATFDDPLNTSGDGTLASGINDTGQIVGTYADASGVHGFLLSGGSYTTLHAPFAPQYTIAQGINGAGQIVGIYFSNHFDHARLHRPLSNKSASTTLHPPSRPRPPPLPEAPPPPPAPPVPRRNSGGWATSAGGTLRGFTKPAGATRASLKPPAPTPPPPPAPPADLIWRGSNTPPAAAGQ